MRKSEYPNGLSVETVECMQMVRRVKRQLVLLWCAVVLLGAAVCLSLFCRSFAPEMSRMKYRTLEAESFELRDWGGEPRAVLQMAGHEVQLLAEGEDGAVLISVPAKEAPLLQVSQNKANASLTFSADGQPLLEFRDMNGRRRVALGLRALGQPELSFFDAAGAVAWSTRPE